MAASTQANKTPDVARSKIVVKAPRPLRPGKTIFDLPGELRNTIYHDCLDKPYGHIPLYRFFRNCPDLGLTSLLLTSSQIFHEVRGYMAEYQTAYIPVMADMDWERGEQHIFYGLPPEIKNTCLGVFEEFMHVHFHLHVDMLRSADYDSDAILTSLENAIRSYTSHSWDLYINHDRKKRHATVHLSHFLFLWTRMMPHDSFIRIEAIKDLVNVMATDPCTIWNVRFYVPTSLTNNPDCYDMKDVDLAQLKRYCSLHSDMSVTAEVYGEQPWAFGDSSGLVTKTRTPATECWPNIHFDANEFLLVGDIVDGPKFHMSEDYVAWLFRRSNP